MKKYVIKSRKLKQYLESKGFICDVDVDRNNPKYNVFLFNYTYDLMQEITIYTNQIHNKE